MIATGNVPAVIVSASKQTLALLIQRLKDLKNAITMLANSGSGSGSRVAGFMETQGKEALNEATRALNGLLPILEPEPTAQVALGEFKTLWQWVVTTTHFSNPVRIGRVADPNLMVALDRLYGLVADVKIIADRIRNLANSGSGSGNRVAAYIQGEGGQALHVAVNAFNALLPIVQAEPLAQDAIAEFLSVREWIHDVTRTATTNIPVTTPSVPPPPPPPPYVPPSPQPPRDRDEPVLTTPPTAVPPTTGPMVTAGAGNLTAWLVGGAIVGLAIQQMRRK